MKIEKPEFYVKKALNRAGKAKVKVKDRKKKERIKVMESMKTAKDSMYEDLTRIEKNFPNLNEVDKLYEELIEIKIGTRKLKENIGRMNWTKNKIVQLHKDYKNRIRAAKEGNMERIRREYYGRTSSLIKKIGKELRFLEESRKKIKKLPKIKTGIRTVCITGFPNVGKSTLLKKLTGADVEIMPYAFTTKDIMMGYAGKELQVIDTPGTLNRAEKMNDIERIAYAAMKHLGEVIIYVFDLTEGCGYALKEQAELMERLEKEIKKEIVIYISKRDLLEREKVLMFRLAHNKHKVFDNPKKLKKYLTPPDPDFQWKK